MTYYTIPPSAMLSDLVRFFWVLESQSPSYTHRSLADVCPEMVFHYNGRFDELTPEKIEPTSVAAIQGPLTRIRRFKINNPFGMFGVYLYPYAIPILFGMPATELSNHLPDLVTLFGNEGSALEETMMLAANNNERVKIITEFLEERLRKNENRQHCVSASIRFIIQCKGLVKIEKVADQHFISQRQFERKFREFSGLTPKLFSRIVRFHAACQQYGNNHKSLTELAYDCGYYDQSHFIHDFKEFSGHHPRHYFSGNAEGTEWKSD
jgi:AraC-like DNA-binding protein